MRRPCPVSLTALACFAVFALTGLFAFDAMRRASTTVHASTELSARPQRVVLEFPISPATAPTERTVVDASDEAQLEALVSQLDNLANRLDDASLWINGELELDTVESWGTLEQLRVTQLRALTLDDLPAKIER